MISYDKTDSPVGPLIAASDDDGIIMLEFWSPEKNSQRLAALSGPEDDAPVRKRNGHLEKLETELYEYFSGKLKKFTVPVVLTGTVFQKRVWSELMNIPYGETRSYMDQASALGMPLAVRAVAGANGANPVSIIIPCHRVIGSNGRLTGYGGGIWRKRWLLDHERRYTSSHSSGLLF